MVNLSSFRRDLWQAFVNQSSRSASSNCCQILSQMLLLCFPKGVAAPPLDSRSQGFHPLDPTPHPLTPSPINGEGEQQAVPSSGVRSTGSGNVTTVCPHLRCLSGVEGRNMGPQVWQRMCGAVVFWVPHCRAFCCCIAGTALVLPPLRRDALSSAEGSSGRGVAASAVGVRFAGRSSTHNAGCSSPRYGSAGSVPLAMALI